MWEIRVTPAGDFDNHAIDYEHIKVEPLSGAMGAEVVGVRLPELSDAAFEELAPDPPPWQCQGTSPSCRLAPWRSRRLRRGGEPPGARCVVLCAARCGGRPGETVRASAGP